MAPSEQQPNTILDEIRNLYKEKDGTLDAFNQERDQLQAAITQAHAQLKDQYAFLGVAGRGGAGLVLKLSDRRLGHLRALKMPRPRGDELMESVKNERALLISLQHDNLAQVYAANDLTIDSRPYPYFVMYFVQDPKDIDQALVDRLALATSGRDIPVITRWLAEQLRHIIEAVTYLHRNNIIHFDIKPANILLDQSGKLVLSDLGFSHKKTDSDTPIVIGFTEFYAHPDLLRFPLHVTSPNRARTWKAPREFAYSWDLYALGRSVLQLLARIDYQYSEQVTSDYTFLYLHLLACRLLDGCNRTRSEIERLRQAQLSDKLRVSVYWESYGSINTNDFHDLKYMTIEEAHRDLQKLFQPEWYLEGVPELSVFYPHRVQISSNSPAPFSRRVKRIVEHPVVLPLRVVKQLGIADSVYPGSTHTRLEHSLGVFRLCCLYLQSLLRDPYEPLFAQLVTEEDLRRLLLAALVHDLGHYPLAHELEDVAPPGLRDCFDHEKLTIEWLKSESRDSEGSTLKAIISDKGGWNVDCGKLISLLQRQGLFLSAKDRLLRSVFDGPVDVDKLDYLVRDSRRCELPYGSAIDVERLVRSLTVLWRSGSVVSLAVYEKGQSAAESVAFARYQMYQAVYWHHTIRAVRPMLREVLRGIERRIGADFKRNKKRKRKTAADFEKAFRNFLGFDNGRREIGLDDVLLFLKGHTDDVGRELVDLIRSRRFYKRVLTIHHYEPPGGQQSLCQQFQARGSNGELDEPLQSEIRDRFSDFLKRHQGPMPTVLAGEKQQDRILDELRKPGRILTDCPRPRIGSDQTLWFVLEPKRLLQSYTSRLRQAERVSELWNDVYSRLMGIASKARVYCHPEIRDGLMASVGPDGIRDAVEKLLENSW